jgi:hypothetical protein
MKFSWTKLGVLVVFAIILSIAETALGMPWWVGIILIVLFSWLCVDWITEKLEK